MSAPREFQIIVYGATGYTGKLVCDVLYHKRACRWAMAGRNLHRLKSTLEEIQLIGRLEDIPLLLATPQDPRPPIPSSSSTSSFFFYSFFFSFLLRFSNFIPFDRSLVELASRTQVLVNCAGPFGLAGDAIVAACLESGTHYLDLSGEPKVFLSSLARFDQKAREKGYVGIILYALHPVCIIHGCGVDSIPWDLGVLTATQGSVQRPWPGVSAVTSYGTLDFLPSTTTVVSVLDICSTMTFNYIPQAFSAWFGGGEKGKGKGLVETAISLVPRVPVLPHFSSEVNRWVFPVPGMLDSLIVRRSAILLHQADSHAPGDYHYGQYLILTSFLHLLLVLVLVAFLFLPVLVLSRSPWLKERFTRFLRSRFGDGPTPSQRKAGSLKIVTVAWDAQGGCVGKSVITCPSDPAYGSTAKWLVESALCLTGEELKVKGGVSTTAACPALGFKLVERLKQANLRFELLS